jgi:hypothetical protein
VRQSSEAWCAGHSGAGRRLDEPVALATSLDEWCVDSTASFSAASSWSTYQTMVGGPDAMVFDGRYLYVHAGDKLARFHARSPAAMPALRHFAGSFF